MYKMSDPNDRKRFEKKQREIAVKEKAERAGLYERACKAVDTHLQAPEGRGTTAHLKLLRQYHVQLNDLQARLSAEFGDSRELTHISIEIDKVKSEIVKLELDLIKPIDKKPQGWKP
jgi:hypothetical protein